MKTLLKISVIYLSILLGSVHGYSQSCAITRVPSSTTMPQAGGQTFQFSIIRNGSCTPIFTVSHSWLTYTYDAPGGSYLRIFATANPGPPRTGYVYVDNKESLKITIDQAGSAVQVTGVSVSPKSAYLNIGETKSLTATVSPSNATNKSVIWTSNNPAVATVNSSSGLVTGVAVGTATITATTANNGHTDNSAITVSALPKSYSWKNIGGSNYTTPAKDQLTGGPCFLFAAVGVIEAKYKISSGQPNAIIDLAEGQVNISCLGQPESIPGVFTFSKNNGIVNEACYPYSSSIYGGGSSPFPNCLSPCPAFQVKVKISDFTCIDFASIAAGLRSEYLRDAIMDNGTVAVSFSGSSLHGGAMHAYEIYGWNENKWLMKDSWQGQANSDAQTDVNIPNIVATNQTNFKACYVTGIGSTNGRSKMSMVNNDPDDVQEHGEADLTIYPNPANTEITLGDFPSDGGLVQLYRSDGCLVFSHQMNSNKIDVAELSQGAYFVKLTINKEIRVLKFIKL